MMADRPLDGVCRAIIDGVLMSEIVIFSILEYPQYFPPCNYLSADSTIALAHLQKFSTWLGGFIASLLLGIGVGMACRADCNLKKTCHFVLRHEFP